MENRVGGLARSLVKSLCSRWWILLVRGLLAVGLGILCFVQPELSLATLVLMFGFYSLADGVLGVVVAIFDRKELEDWWVLLLWGLLSVAIGIMTFANPGITALVLLFYIAAWSIAAGVLQIALAIRIRKEIEGEWFMILAGVLSVLFGMILMARPGEGALAVVWMIGAYAVAFGLILVTLSLRLRSLGRRLAAHSK